MATLQSLFALMVLVTICSAAPKKPTLKIPEECKGKGFCSIKPEGYDEMQAEVNKLLNNQFIAQNFADRIGDDVEMGTVEISPESDWHNCPTRKKREPMYAYSHPNDTESADYIIQNDMIQQPVDIVSCANDLISKENSEKEECFQHFGLSSFNYKSKCETSYTFRNYFVYDYNKKQIVIKSYEVPCCCTCKISSSQ
ncbi:unnamed protein product [Spodoptera littoralis]|uniref:Spaetzle domain-containing protein n=1 Tax=Spodoptera littoralis TaxID=7109 RepID=A0A9P0N944_SPOLI|nr:unnamed protein product [Spodoptera littoralis]CAH1646946.1 unnamed protein product [Spodoptera littoralis]